MAWISQETIEAVKANFIVAAVIALSYVVVYQAKQNEELRKENSIKDENRKKELREDVIFWQNAYFKTSPGVLVRDTIYIPNPGR